MDDKTSSRIVVARERELQALALRKAGATYQDISDRMGISVGAAHKAVMRVLHRLARDADEAGEVLRRLELDRLDALHLAVWQQAMRGKLGAVDRVLRIMERRARLLGLDAPERQHIEEQFEVIVRRQGELPPEGQHNATP